jgi:hypothetical protein
VDFSVKELKKNSENIKTFIRQKFKMIQTALMNREETVLKEVDQYIQKWEESLTTQWK